MTKNDNTIAWGLIGLGLFGVGYALFAPDTTQNNNLQTVRPGGQFGGFTNNTGAAVYVSAAGDILDQLGNIIGQISNLTGNNAANNAAGDGGGDGSSMMAGEIPQGGLL